MDLSHTPAPQGSLAGHRLQLESEPIPANHEGVCIEEPKVLSDDDEPLAARLGLELPRLTDEILVMSYLQVQIPQNPETGDLHRAIATYIEDQRTSEVGESQDDKVIAILEKGVILIGEDDMVVVALAVLGGLHLRQFQRTEKLANIERAVDCFVKVLSLASEDEADRATMLNSLGTSYRGRFNYSRDRADIDRAIQCSTQATELTSDGDTEKPTWLNNLAICYQQRFEIMGDLTDLDLAIEFHTKAVALISEASSSKRSCLEGLGTAYSRRFYSLADEKDISRAIDYQSQALSLANDDPECKSRCLSNFGCLYHGRFRYMGKLVDIDTAITYLSEAVSHTPGGHYAMSTRLNNLAVSYQERFERLAELGDIDSAIKYHKEAILFPPDGHAEKPMRMNNLGIAYQRRFERLGNLEDIKMVVELQSQAVSLSEDGDAQRPVILGSLGVSYQTLYESSKALSDINKAIESQHLAVLSTPEGHPAKPGWLSNLGISLTNRYKHLKAIPDIDAAIEHQARAVLLTPDGFVKKVHYLNNLANSYSARFEHLGNIVDFDLSNKCFSEAVRSPTGLPSMKLKMALTWAKRTVMRNPNSSLDSYKQVMPLITQVIWLGETTDRRYKLLDEIQSGIAAEAAAIAISLRSYDLALEWLENGRSIVWRQMLQLRAPLDELSKVNPALAGELREIAHELESAAVPRSGHVHSSLDWPSLEKMAQHHRRLAERWEDLLGQALVINLHKTRCDALAALPGSNSVVHIPLPSFSFESATKMKEQLLNMLNRGHVRTRSNRRSVYLDCDTGKDRFKFILTSLWLDLVKPILDRLGFLRARTPQAELPCLTWCATGPLSFLPIHAAGLYDESQEKAFDYIVSSYTPTLTSLSHSNQASEAFSGILAVGQSATSGCEPLPGTVTELDQIQKLAGHFPFSRIDGHHATAITVLEAMEKYSWVHLACHASQDTTVPTASAFYLHDKKLDLAAIMRKTFKPGGLAFLSACQTAAGDPQLPDEAIHLAAGLIMAGYSAVIATLWSIRDEDAPLIAESFYTCMLDGGTPDVRRAARALHKAVSDLRGKVGEGEFARWVPYIHIGN